MLSASGPQGVSASTGAVAAHDGVRLAEAVAARAPRRRTGGSCGSAPAPRPAGPAARWCWPAGRRGRAPARGIPPAAARRPCRSPAAACAAGWTRQRVGAGRPRDRPGSPPGWSCGPCRCPGRRSSRAGRPARRPCAAGLVHQRARPFQVGRHVLGRAHLHRGGSQVHVSKLARPVRRPGRPWPAAPVGARATDGANWAQSLGNRRPGAPVARQFPFATSV